MNARIRELGSWSPGQVRVEWVPGSRPIIDSVERLIDDAWSAARRRAGVMLFDGPMCRLESCRAAPGSLHLALSRTSYRTFLGTNMAHPELADVHGPGILANPVGLSAALVTRCGRLMLGRRGGSVAYYPNRIHPFAGALEPHDELDVFAEMQRELREELSLSPADLAEMRCIGLVEDASLRQPELVFEVCSTLPYDMLGRALDSAEHQAAVALPLTPQGLREAIEDPACTPVAAATIALLGRRRLGEQWFASVYPHAVSP